MKQLNKIKFTVEGEPKGKARPRHYGKMVYTPTATKEYEEQVGWCYKASAKEFKFSESDNISISITAYFKIPKSANKSSHAAMVEGSIRPLKKCDTDNIAKIILDGLNGIAYPDDKQIVSLSVEKWYSESPRVEVVLQKI